VVPSYNQGRFLAECLDSLFRQGYPSLEVLVLDGGSADNSVEVIRSFESQLSFWRSHPDGGQAAAINEGFDRAQGEILGWLNSDDLHTANTLATVAVRLSQRLAEPAVFYGGCEIFRQGSNWIDRRPALPFSSDLLHRVTFLDQPSVFWTRAAWDLVGPLDPGLNYTMDWDWFLRASERCSFEWAPEVLSRFRVHLGHKTGSGGVAREREIRDVLRRYSSPEIMAHYDFLASHPLARWWLNKRMRFELLLRSYLPAFSAELANFVSPPFWFLPPSIRRNWLWDISGIR